MSRAERLLQGFADIASSWAPSSSGAIASQSGAGAATTVPTRTANAAETETVVERIRTAMAASPARSPARMTAATSHHPPTSPPISAGGSYEVSGVRRRHLPFFCFTYYAPTIEGGREGGRAHESAGKHAI